MLQGDIDVPLLFGDIELRLVRQQGDVESRDVCAFLILWLTGALLDADRHGYSRMRLGKTGPGVLAEIKESGRWYKGTAVRPGRSGGTQAFRRKAGRIASPAGDELSARAEVFIEEGVKFYFSWVEPDRIVCELVG